MAKIVTFWHVPETVCSFWHFLQFLEKGKCTGWCSISKIFMSEQSITPKKQTEESLVFRAFTVTPCICNNNGLFNGMVQSQGEPGYYKPVTSGCFVDGIFGTLLLEQEYVAIEERAHEANQDAVFEHTATGDTLLF